MSIKTKNILLTTLGNTFDFNRHHYYSYEDDGVFKYCEGISTAEAGAKYIISKVPIDKIIILGPRSAYHDEKVDGEVMLKDLGGFGSDLPEQYSEYKFFCYRIMQFLNRVDIEGSDLLETLSSDEKVELLAALEKIYPRDTWKELFHKFNLNADAYEELIDKLPKTDKRARMWLQHYLYMRMDRSYKMSFGGANDDIAVQFCLTTRFGEKEVRLGNLPNILDMIQDGSDAVNMYVDLQGLDIADSHTLINVLFMLQSERRTKINIQEIITTTYRPSRYTSPIEDQKTRLELSELLSGMDAFLKYGKVDSIRDYWQSRNIVNPHIDRLIFAMQMVDVGITLCSVSCLESGIHMLRAVFADTDKPSDVIESMIFNILETGIRNDYGSLLKGNDINILVLIKWAMRKHFYQQALTIIESRVPNDLVRSGVFFYARNEGEKQEFLHRMAECYWKTPSKDRYQFDDLSHYFIKFYRRQEAYQKKTPNALEAYVDIRLDEIFDPDSPIKAYTTANGKRGIFRDFLLSYLKTGSIRNQVSHAQEVGISEENWSLTALNDRISQFEDSINEFIQQYEKVRNGINKKNVNEWMVTPEEFYEYRNSGEFSAENRAKRAEKNGKGKKNRR